MDGVTKIGLIGAEQFLDQADFVLPPVTKTTFALGPHAPEHIFCSGVRATFSE